MFKVTTLFCLPAGILLLLLLLGACNLSKEVDIDLPEYPSQPVVECYLEPGQPFRLLLTRSFGFFDPLGLDTSAARRALLNGALVIISYKDRTDTLYNGAFSNFAKPFKVFNYQNDLPVPATPGLEYTLQITLADGGTITGKTTMLPVIPIDSTRVQWKMDAGKDTVAQVLTYFTDDPSTTNYYRRLLNYQRLSSLPDQDFLFTDRMNVTPLIAFGTHYDLIEGDTVFNTIFNISKDYYDYYESIQLAVLGNLNPFTQPSTIKSNVQGSANPMGIFTCLAYDREKTLVKR